MNDRWRLKTVALLACAASLTFAGCGGGSDDNPQPSPTRFAAEGFWSGPTVIGDQAQAFSGVQANFWDTVATDGNHMALVILPTGETWIVFITGGTIGGAQYGQAQVAGSSVTIGVTAFSSVMTASTAYTGSIVPRLQLNLTSSDATDGPTTSFRTTYDSRYDQPTSLSQLAGTYTSISGSSLGPGFGSGSGTYYRVPTSTTTSGTAAAIGPGASAPAGGPLPPPAAFNELGNNYTITISSTGAVTLPPDPLGCSGTGSATPRTDSNVFNLSLQFSGSKCVLGNGTRVNGIAVVENGHLLMMAVPPGTPTAGQFVFVSK